MNRLVKALLAHPHVVDEAIPQANAGFEFLLQRLGEEMLSEQEWEGLAASPEVGPPLRSAYLPIITVSEWDHALSRAQQNGPADAGWRTVMLPNSSGEFGLTAPQDSFDDPVVALFTGPPDNPQPVAYRPIEQVYVAVTDGPHCTPPSRGLCTPGACGGCRPRKVWDPATGAGIACRCLDQAPS